MLGAVLSTQDYNYNSQNQRTDLSYDANGNLLALGGYQFTWSGRRLTGASGAHSISYTYDHNGIRTSKTVDGSTISYTVDENNNVITQTDGTDTLRFVYDSNGAPVYMEYNGTVYYYEKNLQGDIVGIWDTIGNTVVQYSYDIWGKLLGITGDLADTVGTANPLRYRGYYYDTETELYYLQSRYYSPELMRFISRDDPVFSNAQGEPIGSNLYVYCLNNPVMNSDPSGNFTIKIYAVAAVTAAIISAVAKIVNNYLNGLRGYKLFSGVLGSAIGSSVNVVLLMKLIKWGNKGVLLAAFAAGAVQAVFDFAEDLLIYKKASWKDLTYNFIFNSAATYAGNYLGGRIIYINGNWFQPKYIKSFFLKPYGQKLIAQTGIGAIISIIIDLTRNGLKKVTP